MMMLASIIGKELLERTTLKIKMQNAKRKISKNRKSIRRKRYGRKRTRRKIISKNSR